MDVEARKFCGLLMFNKPFVSSKGPGSFDSSSNYNNNNNNNNLSSSIIQSNYNINSSANPTTNNNRSNDYISLDNSDDLTSTQITPAQSTTPTSIATHTTQQLDQLQSTLWRIIPKSSLSASTTYLISNPYTP
ncbi:588_t:CDS:2 [Entrophospora sp. SA101]|nr:588_t:CDS:2 [Entrophospora sp. SA101]